MTYTVLESHAYDNILVFVQPTIFHIPTYICTYSDLLNPDFRKKIGNRLFCLFQNFQRNTVTVPHPNVFSYH